MNIQLGDAAGSGGVPRVDFDGEVVSQLEVKLALL
jgi:hypothetical protein